LGTGPSGSTGACLELIRYRVDRRQLTILNTNLPMLPLPYVYIGQLCRSSQISALYEAVANFEGRRPSCSETLPSDARSSSQAFWNMTVRLVAAWPVRLVGAADSQVR